MKPLTFEDVRERVNYEQVIGFFKIEIGYDNKCLCPFHKEDTPSHAVYEKSGHCYGCHRSWDSFAFVQEYLNLSIKDAFRWFEQHLNDLPPQSERKYEQAHYEGPVNRELVDYWHKQLTLEHYAYFEQERLLDKETVDWYQLGYRPDWNAYSVPFWRGLPRQSEVDVMQFRLLDREPKYIGLKGHNRTSFMNAHLLVVPQEYVLVLFGSFDAILAHQDGLTAVGLNGSNISKRDKNRIRDLFQQQNRVIIVPDNTPAEFGPAYELAKLLDADVKFFPQTCPENVDYIDFRKKHSVLEFEYKVLGRLPPVEEETLTNLVTLINAGDRYNIVPVYAWKCKVPAFMAAHLSAECGMDLWGVRSYNDLVERVEHQLKGGF